MHRFFVEICCFLDRTGPWTINQDAALLLGTLLRLNGVVVCCKMLIFRSFRFTRDRRIDSTFQDATAQDRLRTVRPSIDSSDRGIDQGIPEDQTEQHNTHAT
uniref:(northern house mosquito) hypothetical protein n=1 Tax=Culex pipiens TaxID=7175 RepID=A0A8D8K1U2_CULPI